MPRESVCGEAAWRLPAGYVVAAVLWCAVVVAAAVVTVAAAVAIGTREPTPFCLWHVDEERERERKKCAEGRERPGS